MIPLVSIGFRAKLRSQRSSVSKRTVCLLPKDRAGNSSHNRLRISSTYEWFSFRRENTSGTDQMLQYSSM